MCPIKLTGQGRRVLIRETDKRFMVSLGKHVGEGALIR